MHHKSAQHLCQSFKVQQTKIIFLELLLEEFMVSYEVKVILIYEQHWEELPV